MREEEKEEKQNLLTQFNDDPESITVPKLKKLAKSLNIQGFSNMKKDSLITEIEKKVNQPTGIPRKKLFDAQQQPEEEDDDHEDEALAGTTITRDSGAAAGSGRKGGKKLFTTFVASPSEETLSS